MSKERGVRAFQNARLQKQQKKNRLSLDESFSQAVALHQQGRIAEAQPLYRQIVLVAPKHFDALYFLGVSEFQTGQLAAANDLLEQALQVRPQSAEALSTRALILNEQKQFADALACCDKAIAINGSDADSFNIRGNALLGLGRVEEALASYDNAVSLKPDFVGAISNRGNALKRLMRFDDALATFDKAISIQPGFAEAHNNRGSLLRDLERLDEALVSYERAITLRPNYVDALSNRGIVLLELDRTREAMASFNSAIKIDPGSAEAFHGRGEAFRELLRFDDALANFDHAIAIRPDYVEAHSNRGLALVNLMRTDEALASFDKALSIKPDFAAGLSSKIFFLDFMPTTGFEIQQRARKDWWEAIGSKVSQSPRPHKKHTLEPERKLIIGYVSGDFRRHSSAASVKPVLRNHNKSRFEIICYSSSSKEDEMTKEFQQLADRWFNVSHMSDDQLSRKIEQDAVDILVDLSGHSLGNRLGAFAQKPAPIQITAWGHAAGTGLPTIDYIFSDPVAIPPAARHLFAEKIYDLPCLITLEEPPDEFRSSEAPLVHNKYITFGVYNRVSKISEMAIATWSRILHATPKSRLLIKDLGLDNEAIRNRLLEKFANQNISTDRIDLLGPTSRDQHLMAFKNVDICLDPFPVGGGVSTWEAIYMGVPVVAMAGDGVSARLAAAILSSIGLSNWVANDEKGYFDLAVSFAGQHETIANLRRRLPTLLSSSSAANNAKYTLAVEDAYRTMWADYCAQQVASVSHLPTATDFANLKTGN
jgi:predicted O-linked N-acetylglucosamine transferase (SPINDLY family)